MRPHHVGHRV